MLFSVLLAILFGRYFSKPIVQLSRIAKIWGAGHLDIKFALQHHRNDEIGSLSEQLQGMATQLARKIREQDDLNNELSTTNEKLQELYFDVEKYNQNIKASINYAERIQKAMLPNKERIQGFFADSFVFFQPKNIVSGDFYFFYELKATPKNIMSQEVALTLQHTTHSNTPNHFVASFKRTKTPSSCIIAAIDCTGHGVPGALMSVIGHNILQQLIGYEELTEPARILYRLNEEVQRILQQEHSRNKDGMDVGLCHIDFAENQLQFAGVHRPLVYFTNAGEFCEIKGNKISIGGNPRQNKAWQVDNHSLSLKDLHTFYLYSDGYADQFNDAPYPTKFTNKAFKQLLTAIHTLDTTTQEQILQQEHQLWRGTNWQTDDILVIGVQIKA
jgi:serine phosphatase RsbU (regulator of sigma subunit)